MSERRIEAAGHPPYVAWLSGVLLAMAIALAVSACNTMRGAGEDVSAAGDALSGTAQNAEDEMD